MSRSEGLPISPEWERDRPLDGDIGKDPSEPGWGWRLLKRFAPGAAALPGVTLFFGGCAPSEQPPEITREATPQDSSIAFATKEPTATPNPTATRRAIITPVPLGAVMPEACKGNPAGERGWQKATNKQRPLTEEDESDIEAFNECAKESLAQSIATSTAEAAKQAATPTEAPKPSPTTPPLEATPIPKAPENPLPKYGVFFGNLTNPGTGVKRAEMVMASIPQKEGLDEIFIYYITVRDPAGRRMHTAFQLKPSKTAGNHFELGAASSPSGVVFRPAWGKADFDPEQKTIKGTGVDIGDNSEYELEFVGTGKETILATMKQIITDLSSDQPTTPKDELALFKIKADLWP